MYRYVLPTIKSRDKIIPETSESRYVYDFYVHKSLVYATGVNALKS
jgi:hypothetical protein